ncbi:MAG: preprotein translocase subunit YajC [Halobacteriovoraceae bacterium]|nr:preprotein translocase subunit YajC [Halobacteriovoraceae bacterium]
MFLLNFLSNAYAEQAAPPAPGGFTAFVPFILIFAIFYFLMIRPQKKRLQEEQNMLNALGKGDEIFTKSGILGKIIGLTDKIVTLEVADGVKLKVLKAQVGGLAKRLFDKEKK